MAAAIACYLVVPCRGSRRRETSGRLDEHSIGIPALRKLQDIVRAAAWRPGRLTKVLPFWGEGGRSEGRGYVCGIVKLQSPGSRQVDVLSANTSEVRFLLSLLNESTPRSSTVAYAVQEAFSMSQFAGEQFCPDACGSNDPRLLPMAARRELFPTQTSICMTSWKACRGEGAIHVVHKEFQTLVSSFRKEILELSPGCLETLLALHCFDRDRDAGSVQNVCEAWGVATPTLALQIPAVFLVLILRRSWSSILLQVPVPVGELTANVPKPEDDTAQVLHEPLALTAHSLDMLGDAIRIWAPHILAADAAGQGALPLECSHAYVSGMADFVDGAVQELTRASCQGHTEVPEHLFGGLGISLAWQLFQLPSSLSSNLVPGVVRAPGYAGHKFVEAHLLRCVILADMLKSDGDLSQALEKAGSMTFLPRLGDEDEFADYCAPGPSLLTQARLWIDGAWCQAWGNSLFELEALPPMYLMADSSPQFGKDWFIAELTYIDPAVCSSATEFLAMVSELQHSSSSNNSSISEHDTVLASQTTKRLVSSMARHCFIPTSLASGRASVQHKCNNFLHAVYMEFGDWSRVRTFLRNVDGFTSDMGAEAQMALATFDPDGEGSLKENPTSTRASSQFNLVVLHRGLAFADIPRLGQWRGAQELLLEGVAGSCRTAMDARPLDVPIEQ
eukprot:6464199-Amphidinium_carterae.1